MSKKRHKLEHYLQLYRGSASVNRTHGSHPEDQDSARKKDEQCPACGAELTDSVDGQRDCESCESQSRVSSRNYSGHEPQLVTGHDRYFIKPPVKPQKRKVNQRRHPRIPCRNVRACIESEEASAVVEVINISRGGLSFVTADKWFALGTPVSIAMHYAEGGENIFQEGRIVRIRTRSLDPPIEYGVEFSRSMASQHNDGEQQSEPLTGLENP